MTAEDHNTVDFVALDMDQSLVSLVIVEGRDWGERGSLLPDLQKKLNTYIGYVVEGQLESDYPQVAGMPVQIELRSLTAPGERELGFLEIVRREYLDPASIGFSWKLIDSAAS